MTIIQFELSEFLNTPFTFFHPEVKKDKMKGVPLRLGQLICYSDEKYLSGISTLDDIVAGFQFQADHN